MNKKLREINSIKGVWGYFVCDNTGEIVEREMPVVFMKHLAMTGKEVAQVVALLESLNRSPKNLDLLFEDGRLIIRSLKGFSLVVFCDPNVDMGVVNAKGNEVISEIRGDAKIREALEEGDWRRRKLLQKQYLSPEYWEILNQLMPKT